MGDAESIKIKKRESQEVFQGQAENFTGRVAVKILTAANQPSRTSVAEVAFGPGARTVWHTHPYGQTLVVTKGLGRVQQWGGPLQEIGKGDTVWFPAGVKHWHGASPDADMTHIAIQEEQNASTVEWLEAVTEAQYTS